MPRTNKYEVAEIRRESQYLLQQMDTAASATKLVHFSGSLGECGASFGFRKLIGVVRSKYLSDGLHGSEGGSVSVEGTDSLSFCNCAGLLAL